MKRRVFIAGALGAVVATALPAAARARESLRALPPDRDVEVLLAEVMSAMAEQAAAGNERWRLLRVGPTETGASLEVVMFDGYLYQAPAIRREALGDTELVRSWLRCVLTRDD